MIAWILPSFVLPAILALAPGEMDPEAKERLTRGLEQYQAKEYAPAIKEFRLAYALDPRAEILFAWAQAERLYGRCSRASKLYRRFLGSKPSAQQAEAARQGLDRCEGQADTAPDDPEDVVPEPEAAPAPEPEPVPEDTQPEAPPPAPKRRVDGLGIGLLAGGVVVGGAGVGVLGAAAGKASDVEDATAYDDFADGVGRVRTLRIAGGVLAGVGAALIVAGVVRLVVRARAPRRDLSLWTTPHSAGLVMRLRF